MPGAAAAVYQASKSAIVAEINYATWEKGAVLRQTSFEAVREDKPAS
jgi:ATP-dependent DNA ligase